MLERIDSTEEWIETRSGIRTRHFAEPDETLALMATQAAAKALSQAGLTAPQVDCVIVASMSNVLQTPPLAMTVAHRLGARGAAAFDLSAACAGFCHALAVAADTVAAGGRRARPGRRRRADDRHRRAARPHHRLPLRRRGGSGGRRPLRGTRHRPGGPWRRRVAGRRHPDGRRVGSRRAPLHEDGRPPRLPVGGRPRPARWTGGPWRPRA
ncbi:hypothetical protein GCM10020000_67580 [Streptomyces olivoverticillatus]